MVGKPKQCREQLHGITGAHSLQHIEQCHINGFDNRNTKRPLPIIKQSKKNNVRTRIPAARYINYVIVTNDTYVLIY